MGEALCRVVNKAAATGVIQSSCGKVPTMVTKGPSDSFGPVCPPPPPPPALTSEDFAVFGPAT